MSCDLKFFVVGSSHFEFFIGQGINYIVISLKFIIMCYTFTCTLFSAFLVAFLRFSCTGSEGPDTTRFNFVLQV